MRDAREDAFRARDEIEIERDETAARIKGMLPFITSGEVTDEDIANAAHEIRWLADALVEHRLKSAQDEADRLDQMLMDHSERYAPAGSVSH